MILYIKYTKDSTKKLLQLINLLKLQDTNSTYKNQLHFYTLIINFLSEKEIKKTVPFTIALKIIKYLGINLTKEVKDLYIQNFKTLMKETEEGTNK